MESGRIKRASTKGVSMIRAISEQKTLLETTVSDALKLGKSDLFMDTPFVDTPFSPARWNSGGGVAKCTEVRGVGNCFP